MIKYFFTTLLILLLFSCNSPQHSNKRSYVDLRKDSIVNLEFFGYKVDQLMTKNELKQYQDKHGVEKLFLLNNKTFSLGIRVEDDKEWNGKNIQGIGANSTSVREYNTDFKDLMSLYQSKYGQCSYYQFSSMDCYFFNHESSNYTVHFAVSDSFNLRSRTYFDQFYRGETEDAEKEMNSDILRSFEFCRTNHYNILTLVWEWKNQSISLSYMTADDTKYDDDEEDEACIKIVYRNYGYIARIEREKIQEEERKKEQALQAQEEERKREKEDSLRKHQSF